MSVHTVGGGVVVVVSGLYLDGMVIFTVNNCLFIYLLATLTGNIATREMMQLGDQLPDQCLPPE